MNSKVVIYSIRCCERIVTPTEPPRLLLNVVNITSLQLQLNDRLRCALIIMVFAYYQQIPIKFQHMPR